MTVIKDFEVGRGNMLYNKYIIYNIFIVGLKMEVEKLNDR
jgi:hypothetical protein